MGKANALGYEIYAASELEYYVYENSYALARERGYEKDGNPAVSAYVEDYHLLQTSREEPHTQVSVNTVP